MPLGFIIGAGAGIVSAVAFASATSGPMAARVLFFLLSPLPLFLAGLGWGTRTALIGGAAGSLAVALVFNGQLALAFAVSEALPAALLCYLAGLSRTTQDPASGQPVTEWYPVGRLVIWASAIGGTLALLSLFLLGDDLETLRSNVQKIVEPIIKSSLPEGPEGAALSEEELSRIADIAMYALPAASALSWTGGLLFNLYLAGRIAMASGGLARPWPDLAATTYPPGTPLAFAVATAATFLGGYPALVAACFAGALFFSYVLLGLAVIHYVTRGNSWRPFVLWAVYSALIFINTFVPPLIAMLGLADAVAGLRRPPPPPPRAGPPPTPLT